MTSNAVPSPSLDTASYVASAGYVHLLVVEGENFNHDYTELYFEPPLMNNRVNGIAQVGTWYAPRCRWPFKNSKTDNLAGATCAGMWLHLLSFVVASGPGNVSRLFWVLHNRYRDIPRSCGVAGDRSFKSRRE